MFSVVMPVWNKRGLIEATLASVFAQTWRDFELIAVDDASTDGTRQLMECTIDPRFRLLTQHHQGAGAARNAGMMAARHEWIAFLDADDLWLADHLAELNRVRQRHPEAGLIGTAFTPATSSGRVKIAGKADGEIKRVNYFEAAAVRDNLLFTSSVAIRADVYRTLGGFDDVHSGHDKIYWAKIALVRPVATSTRVTAVYRRHTGGITDTNPRLFAGGRLRSLDDIYPVVGFLLSRVHQIRQQELRRGVLLYIDRHVQWAIRQAAEVGDEAALRKLPLLWPRSLTVGDRLFLLLGRLPRLLRRAVFWSGRLLRTR